MAQLKPLPPKELKHIVTWITPILVLILCTFLLPTYFETKGVVRKGAVTLVGVLLLFVLPAAARHFERGRAVRRLAIHSLFGVGCVVLWLLYGELWDGTPEPTMGWWVFGDVVHWGVGWVVAWTRNERLWLAGVLSLVTGVLLVFVPVSRSTAIGHSPAVHPLLFLILWGVEMSLGGALYSGIDFIYLLLVSLPALRMHIYAALLYTCILVSFRAYEFTVRCPMLFTEKRDEDLPGPNGPPNGVNTPPNGDVNTSPPEPPREDPPPPPALPRAKKAANPVARPVKPVKPVVTPKLPPRKVVPSLGGELPVSMIVNGEVHEL